MERASKHERSSMEAQPLQAHPGGHGTPEQENVGLVGHARLQGVFPLLSTSGSFLT